MSDVWKNILYYGDNLGILREKIKDESVDLIYLDPPFNSNANYNILFKEQNGLSSQAQITAFEDTWHWVDETSENYHNIIKNGTIKVSNLMQSFVNFLGRNDLSAYLTMMAIRLVELHRVLKPSGSIYLHCDPTSSHYLKLLLDAIFGFENFRNEIIWSYRRWTGKAKRFQCLHDDILFYTKTGNYTFNTLYTDYTQKSLYRKKWYHTRKKGDDVFQTSINENGVRKGDVWEIPVLNSQAKERLGYPTQKPEALLEYIIKASSNEGDIILDPFCGCGTTINVAEQFKRRWIGIDITYLAINLIKKRLQDTFASELSEYETLGDPKDLNSAIDLSNRNKYQFEWWAVYKVGAIPAQDKKKGADKGIDGFINFYDDNSDIAKKIVIQVKSGHINPSQIRDLKGVVGREKASIGVFITLREPTKSMKDEAIASGFYIPEFFPNKHYPKLQILTIEEILNGKQIEYYDVGKVNYKKSERKYKNNHEQMTIF